MDNMKYPWMVRANPYEPTQIDVSFDKDGFFSDEDLSRFLTLFNPRLEVIYNNFIGNKVTELVILKIDNEVRRIFEHFQQNMMISQDLSTGRWRCKSIAMVVLG